MAFWYIFVGVLYLAPLALCVGMIIKWVAGYLEALIRYPAKRFGLHLPSVVITTWDKTLGSLWSWANLRVGALEYTVAIPRNYTIGVGYAVYLFYLIMQALWSGEAGPQTFSRMAIPAVVTFLSVISYQRFIFASLKIAEFLRSNPCMSPEAFFEWFYQLLGPIPYKLPDPHSQAVVDPTGVDFGEGTLTMQSHRLVFKGLLDTAHLAHICLRNLKYLGPESAREIFDCMASMWGKRTLQLFHASFRVEGVEILEQLEGRIVLSFNHKSHMDFVMIFFALSGIRLPSGRGIRPRFITAKDHFVDNFVVYELLGIGRLIETVDMVFIERRKSGKGLDTLSQAARFVAEKPIDIAIFPQGTRAVPHRDRSGERMDAGYFTTFSPRGAHDDTGHIKKGLAFLAVDAARTLRGKGEETPLHIVNIGIEGTASMVGKGASSAQTRVPVVVRVGEVIHVAAEDVKGLEKPRNTAGTPGEARYMELVEQIYHRTDRALIEVSRIREKLGARFLSDLRGDLQLAPERIERVRMALEAPEGVPEDVYKALDRLYACPVKNWDPCLLELARLLEAGGPAEGFKAFRGKVTQTLLENFKQKQHGKKVRKPARHGDPEKRHSISWVE